MAKHIRLKPTRAPRKKLASRSTAPATRAATVIPPVIPTAAAVERKAPPPPPGPPPRKPGYYEAIAIYESGVRALQRHDYEKAADQFREIINRYPQERELHERSVLYLRVCERETARRPAGPQTPQERVYAATVALNAGDAATALDHLRRALTDSPDSDHAHYIMALALASPGQSAHALGHSRRSIELNPENRARAKQDPDLEDVRDLDGFRETLETPSSLRPRPRRRR